MAIHGSGTSLSFTQIQTEFGSPDGLSSISLSEYYGEGTLPSGGSGDTTIKVSDFYGQSAATTEQPSNASAAIISLTGTTASVSGMGASIGANGIHDYDEHNKSNQSGWWRQPSRTVSPTIDSKGGETYEDYAYLFYNTGTAQTNLPQSFSPNNSNYYGANANFPKFGLNSSYYTLASTNTSTWKANFGLMKSSNTNKPDALSLTTGYWWVGWTINMSRSRANTGLGSTNPTWTASAGGTSVNFSMTLSRTGTTGIGNINEINGGSTIISLASSGTFGMNSFTGNNSRYGAIWAIAVNAV